MFELNSTLGIMIVNCLIVFFLVCYLDIKSSESHPGIRKEVIKVPSDVKKLAGCTEIIGNLIFEIPQGTGIILCHTYALYIVYHSYV